MADEDRVERVEKTGIAVSDRLLSRVA